MRFAVQYRLKPEHEAADRASVADAYEELLLRRPSWLSCETLQVDGDLVFVLLIDTDHHERLDELPRLSAHLRTLQDRCESEPRVGPLESSDFDASTTTCIGAWYAEDAAGLRSDSGVAAGVAVEPEDRTLTGAD